MDELILAEFFFSKKEFSGKFPMLMHMLILLDARNTVYGRNFETDFPSKIKSSFLMDAQNYCSKVFSERFSKLINEVLLIDAKIPSSLLFQKKIVEHFIIYIIHCYFDLYKIYIYIFKF